MKTALAMLLALSLTLGLAAQTRRAANTAPVPPRAPAATDNGPNLNSILADVQRIALSTSGDLNKLRIEKWKTDDSQKKDLQQVADSLQRNITTAVPGLLSDLQATPGSVSKAFKLYHNLNVVYEYLNSLADAAGAFGKKEEYSPLAADASALDSARQNLSNYIEQAATNLETQTKKPPVAPAQSTTTQQQPKKIVIDDSPTPKKKKKATPQNPPQ